MVLVDKWNFFHLFIFGKIGKKKFFGDILKRKNAFLDYIKKKQKKLKNWPFPKGLVHGFGQKMGFFPPFHLWQNRQENSLWRYSRKKKRFSRLKNKKQKKSKNWPFPKGLIPGFGQ